MTDHGTGRPIFDPEFWRVRLAESPDRRDAIYAGACKSKWDEIDELWRKALARNVAADTAILDVGCGYGRLLDLLPPHWNGFYFGVDLCPEFIDLARKRYPRPFAVYDLRERQYGLEKYEFDLAVCGMFRGMVRGNAPETWPAIEENIRRCAKNILYLEVDGEEPQ